MIVWFTESVSTALSKAQQKLSGPVRGLKTQVTSGTGISSTFMEVAYCVTLAAAVAAGFCALKFDDAYYMLPLIASVSLLTFLAKKIEGGQYG